MLETATAGRRSAIVAARIRAGVSQVAACRCNTCECPRPIRPPSSVAHCMHIVLVLRGVGRWLLVLIRQEGPVRPRGADREPLSLVVQSGLRDRPRRANADGPAA